MTEEKKSTIDEQYAKNLKIAQSRIENGVKISDTVVAGNPDNMAIFDEKANTSIYTDDEYDMMRNFTPELKIGKVYEGKYIGETNNEYLVDCNFKDFIRVNKSAKEKIFYDKIEVGEIIDVVVTNINDISNIYTIEGSTSIIYEEKSHAILSNLENNEYVLVDIEELTPGGYVCTINMNNCIIDAFLPQYLAGMNKINDSAKSDLVGKQYKMCIETYVKDKNTWIVSRRKYLKQIEPMYIDQLDMSQKYSGWVTGTKSFGIFVEFNECLTGMIHKSNLSDEYVDDFESIKPGQEIEFYIKEVIRGKKNKIILTQILNDNSLWDKIQPKDEYTGTVIAHKSFGTLVKIDDETNGLIHVSKRDPKITELKKGEKVDVFVLIVDKASKKIYLDTK